MSTDAARNLAGSGRQQRLQITATIAALFGVLLSLFAVAFTIYILNGGLPAAESTLSFGTDGALLLCIVLYGIGTITARLGRLEVASTCTILGANLSVILSTIFWSFLLHNGLDPITFSLFAACDLMVVLAGVLGNRWTILVTAFTMSVYTLLLIQFATIPNLGSGAASGNANVIEHERGLFTLLVVLILWAVTAVTITISQSFRRTLTDLERANDEARQLDTLKDLFITHINHELRTPIMTLQGSVEYLRLVWPELAENEINTALANASRAGYSLIELLNSILDVRRIDEASADIPREAVSIQAALETAMTLVNPRETTLSGREIRLLVPKQLAIWGDPIRLQQILTNLLTNAAKYSAATTPIEVKASVVSDRTNRGSLARGQVGEQRYMAEITVRDYGLGIPHGQEVLLFNRFVRLPRDLASQVIGNGLGLYLCRVMAEAMGGRIWVESTGVEGEGSTFHVVLPVAPTWKDDKDSTDPRLHVAII